MGRQIYFVSNSFQNIEPHIKTHSITTWLQSQTASLGENFFETRYTQVTPHPVEQYGHNM